LITSKFALLRHLWAMMQTRGEAAGLVLRLQLDAVGRGLAWFAIGAVAAIGFTFALLLLVAFGTPQEYRVAALGTLTLALLIAAIACTGGARRHLRRDVALISDFTAGLRLDLAMINLALKDSEADDEKAIAERERAKSAVREAAAAKAATSDSAEAPGKSEAGDTAEESAPATVHPASAVPTELDLPPPSVTAPEAMTRPRTEERTQHGPP
jgi:hypothetical protein